VQFHTEEVFIARARVGAQQFVQSVQLFLDCHTMANCGDSIFEFRGWES
jgi:hypothetical protein